MVRVLWPVFPCVCFRVCCLSNEGVFPQDGKHRTTGIDYVFLSVFFCTFLPCGTFNKLTFSAFVAHLLAFASQRFDREKQSYIYLKSLSLLDFQEGRHINDEKTWNLPSKCFFSHALTWSQIQPFMVFFPEQGNNDAILEVSSHSLYLSWHI